MKKLITILSITLLIVLTSCTQKEEIKNESNTWLENNNVESQNINNASNTETIVKEFTMESFTNIIDWKYYPKFSPDRLEVNKGDTVRIKLTVLSWVHDFKLDEFNVYAGTPTWEETIIEFVADKAWSFEYYCNQPWHRLAWHWGTLVVNP